MAQLTPPQTTSTLSTVNTGVERTQTREKGPTEIRIDYLTMTFKLSAGQLVSATPALPITTLATLDAPAQDSPQPFLTPGDVRNWLNSRAPGWDPDKWRDMPGRHRYRKAYAHQSGAEIYYDGQANMGVHLELTGSVCRALERAGMQDWQSFLNDALARGAMFRRIDIALDDRAERLDLATMFHAFDNGHVSTKFEQWEALPGKRRIGVPMGTAIETIYVGRTREERNPSDTIVVIYDKRVEQIARGYDDPGQWIRVELRCYRAGAHQLGKRIADLGLTFVGPAAVKGKLDFKTPKTTDTNKRRWPTALWWAEFLDTAAEVYLTPYKPTDTIERKFRWFMEGGGAKALAMTIEAYPGNPALLIRTMLDGGAQQMSAHDREVARAARRLTDDTEPFDTAAQEHGLVEVKRP